MSRLRELFGRWLRQTKRVFHMLIGLVYLFLAFAGGVVSFSEWQRYRKNPEVGVWPFGVPAGFTVLLIVLCLYSFAKARSVR